MIRLIIDLEQKFIGGIAKVADIKRYGLIRASAIYPCDAER